MILLILFSINFLYFKKKKKKKIKKKNKIIKK